MVENVEPQEMEEMAYKVQHSLPGAHQAYELHLVGHKEQMIVLKEGEGCQKLKGNVLCKNECINCTYLSPYHFSYLLMGWPQPQSWLHA
jgi:hypothetical protein